MVFSPMAPAKIRDGVYAAHSSCRKPGAGDPDVMGHAAAAVAELSPGPGMNLNFCAAQTTSESLTAGAKGSEQLKPDSCLADWQNWAEGGIDGGYCRWPLDSRGSYSVIPLIVDELFQISLGVAVGRRSMGAWTR